MVWIKPEWGGCEGEQRREIGGRVWASLEFGLKGKERNGIVATMWNTIKRVFFFFFLTSLLVLFYFIYFFICSEFCHTLE